MKRFLSIFLAVCLCVSLLAVGVMATEPAAPSDATRKGIDVSYAQGTINWAEVKDDGIDFVIIQCGYGQDITSQDDVQFQNNVAGCEKYGIPYGIYLYSYATTVAGAQGEADHALRLIEDYCGSMFQLPVYYDMEQDSIFADGVDTAAIANAFCSKIENAGYQAGIYSNLNNWNGKLSDSSLNQWYKWVAQYNTQCDYTGTYQIWQCTDSGSVAGISGNVDINYMIGDPDDHASVADSLTTDKTTYAYGDAINVTATSQRGSAWVGIYGANDDPKSTSSYYWYYVSGTGEPYGRSLTWESGKTYNLLNMIKTTRYTGAALPIGSYKVVLLAYDAEGDYETLATKNITIVEAENTTVSLATSKENYVTGEDIMVTATSSKEKAWVGIFYGALTANSDFTNKHIYYYYTAGKNGSAVSIGDQTLNANDSSYSSLPSGTYTIALFGDAGYTNVDATVQIDIMDYIATDKDIYVLGEPIYVTTNFSNTDAWEWVGVHGAEDAFSSTTKVWYYICNVSDQNDVNVYVSATADGVTYNSAITSGNYKVSVFDHWESSTPTKTVTFKVIEETGRTVTNPTCTTGGYTTITYSDNSTKVVDPTDALGHNYTAKTTAATCTTAGYTTYTCTRCSDSYTVTGDAAKGHSYTSVVTAPTCTASGYTTNTCTVCNDVNTTELTDPLDHTETTVNASAATCTAAGYTGDTVCTVCGETLVTGTETAALGHDYTATVTLPTCTDDGYTTYVCSRDSSHTYTDSPVAALGHTWGDYTVTKEPTHTESGEMTRYCSVCGTADTAVVTIKKTPAVDLQVRFADGRLVMTGIFDDYANKSDYIDVTAHGIVVMTTNALDGCTLSVDLDGRTVIQFQAYTADGTGIYYMSPVSTGTSYTMRAFVAYADPATGKTVYIYSDPIVGSYDAYDGQTLTTADTQS